MAACSPSERTRISDLVCPATIGHSTGRAGCALVSRRSFSSARSGIIGPEIRQSLSVPDLRYGDVTWYYLAFSKIATYGRPIDSGISVGVLSGDQSGTVIT
jgi:hypothetical protein